jgi:hypothetical protein
MFISFLELVKSTTLSRLLLLFLALALALTANKIEDSINDIGFLISGFFSFNDIFIDEGIDIDFTEEE